MNFKHGFPLLLFVLILTSRLVADEPTQVNAFLPGQKQIWPLTTVETPVEIEATFLSSTEVKKVTVGNWVTTTYRITYDVNRVIRGKFEPKQLVFLCDEQWPTPESGIMLKALPFPFHLDTSGTFYLKGSGDRYLIRSYSLASTTKQ